MKRRTLSLKKLVQAMMVFAFIVPVLFTGNASAVTILETSPTNNEEDVAVDTSVTATFENDMESFDESKFYIVTYSQDDFAPAQPINGTATYADKVATWTPTQNLELNVEYYATIVGGVSGVKEQSGSTLDFDYKWKFNTGIRQVIQPADPAIAETSSGNGEKDVAVDADITITFAEDMDPGTINGDTFYIMTYPQDDLAAGERIPAEDVEVTYSDKTATLKLKEGTLDPETDYYVTIAASDVKDTSGESPMTLDYKWKFTTSSTTELTALIDSPASNAVINEGDMFNFQGTVENGGASPVYSWDFGGGADNSGMEDPGNVTFDTGGDYTVTFTVTDADSQESSATVTVKVISGGDLAISMTPSENLAIAQGSSVDFQGTVTVGNAPFTYSWNFSDDAIEDSDLEDPGDTAFETKGDYTVTFIVTDKDSQDKSVSVTITVEPVGKGDIDGNGSVNLADAILTLQVCAGITSSSVNKEAAVNNDKIGIEDAVYILMEIVNIDT